MLKIVVPAWEDWDPVRETFVVGREATLFLEHSLISLSKWEAKHHKSFLENQNPTEEEMIDYIKCMRLPRSNNEVSDAVYDHLTQENVKEIFDYISDPMTATTINHRQQGKARGKREVMTAEIFYYYMIELGIPFECQTWHLNKLQTLISVCSIKGSNNGGSKKMSRRQMAKENAALNAARRSKHHSRG